MEHRRLGFGGSGAKKCRGCLELWVKDCPFKDLEVSRCFSAPYRDTSCVGHEEEEGKHQHPSARGR